MWLVKLGNIFACTSPRVHPLAHCLALKIVQDFSGIQTCYTCVSISLSNRDFWTTWSDSAFKPKSSDMALDYATQKQIIRMQASTALACLIEQVFSKERCLLRNGKTILKFCSKRKKQRLGQHSRMILGRLCHGSVMEESILMGCSTIKWVYLPSRAHFSVGGSGCQHVDRAEKEIATLQTSNHYLVLICVDSAN